MVEAAAAAAEGEAAAEGAAAAAGGGAAPGAGAAEVKIEDEKVVDEGAFSSAPPPPPRNENGLLDGATSAGAPGWGAIDPAAVAAVGEACDGGSLMRTARDAPVLSLFWTMVLNSTV